MAEQSMPTESRTFRPLALAEIYPDWGVPDIVLRSNDNILFHVHWYILTGISRNEFATLLRGQDWRFPIAMDETADMLNILLHAVYNIPVDKYQHPLSSIVSAFDRMPHYGLDPSVCVAPSTAMHHLLVRHVPFNALLVYAVAGQLSLETLAVQASGHLLTLDAENIPREMVARMGTKYYRRLYNLLEGRMDRLKCILGEYVEPPSHVDCENRDVSQGKAAWNNASLDMIQTKIQPNLSPQYLAGLMKPFANTINCQICLTVFESRVKAAMQEWSEVKCTI